MTITVVAIAILNLTYGGLSCAGVSGRQDDSIDQLKESCRKGRGSDCSTVGIRLQADEREVSQRESVQYFELGCAANDASSCHAAGQAYLFGQGVERDVQRAMPLLTSGCDKGDPHACFKLGSVQMGGAFGPPIDRQSGFRYVRMSCDMGLPQGCFLAGSTLEAGHLGGKADPVTAKKLFAIGCGVSDAKLLPSTLNSIGQASSCLRVGIEYSRPGKSLRETRRGETMLRMVRDYFSEQCAAGDSLSCMSLGTMYAAGQGLTADVPRGHELFKRACELKNPAGCMLADRTRLGDWP
jgi:TPR repeat protein